MSIMPSMPMFTTPLRSEIRPPSAPHSSGVANRSIAAISADHVTTSSRWPVPDWVAANAPAPPIRPAAIAPQPRRFSPWVTATAPSVTAISPSAIEGTGVRRRIGGSAMNHASTPSAIPVQATGRAGTARVPSAVATAVLTSGLRPSPARHQPSTAPQDRDHEHVGRDEQDDEALDDRREVRGQRGLEDRRVEVALRRAAQQRAEEQRREQRADGRVAPEQRDGDPEEADLRDRDVVRRDAELPAEDVHRAG